MSENPKIYVADKETLDKIYNILAAQPVYGFIEHNAILAPGERIEYIGLNRDFKQLTVTMGGGFALNGWAGFPWLLGNKPYMVRSDGTPDYRLKEDDYTKKEDGSNSDVSNTAYDGGAFAWAPKIYKREYMAGDDRYVLFRFDKADGFEAVGFIDGEGNELEGAWIPMFYGATTGDTEEEKMRSLSGTQPQHTVTTEKQKAAIDKVGTRARFFGGPLLETLVDLAIMFAKTTNLQAAYGIGNSSGYDSSQTPTMGVKQNNVVGGGQFFGTSDGKTLNKIFHSIVLGSYNIWIRDPYLLEVNGRLKVSTNYEYDVVGTSYLDTGIQVPDDAEGWDQNKNKLTYPSYYRTVPGYGCLPAGTMAGGSTTTGGCDGIWRKKPTEKFTGVSVRLGYCDFGAAAGGRSASLDGAAGNALWGLGSALLLLPPVGVSA